MPVTLTIRGLYSYSRSLFDGIELPGDLDTNTLINEILLRTIDLEVLYPDFDFMKAAIAHWSKKNQYVWQKLYDTTILEYNPIYNKDGTYTEKETRDLKGTSHSGGKSTETGKVNGFNSSTLQNHDQRITEPDLDNTATDTGTILRERHEYGNIGVTTTQQMIKEERDVAIFNMYEIIADMFKTEFCLMVY